MPGDQEEQVGRDDWGAQDINVARTQTARLDLCMGIGYFGRQMP